LKYNIVYAIPELIITRGTHIIKYFKNWMITHVFSACHIAITLQAAHIGDHAQPIDVHEFNPHARAVQAAHATIQLSLKLSRVETIAILYGTLSIKTESIADHIVIIQSKNVFQTSQSSHLVISTSFWANKSITQLCSNDQTTINSHAKKNNVA